MSRSRTGTIRRKTTSQGISYSLRWREGGRNCFHHIGGSWEGWTEQRVEQEREYVMGKVNRGEYTTAAPAPAPSVPTDVPTFQVAASNWLHRHKLSSDPEGTSKTSVDLTWRLTSAIRFFGHVPIDQLGFRHASDMVATLQTERLEIARAAERGEPLMEEYVDSRTGRTYRRRRRSLANSSIRKILDASERVLADARRRGEFLGEVPELKAAVGRVEKPRRSYLEVEQLVACVRAAQLLEDERRGMTWEKAAEIRASGRPNLHLAREYGVSDTLIRKIKRGELWREVPQTRRRNDVPRYPLLLTLALAGPRVAELCALDAQDVDTTAARVRIDGTKTDAATRVVPLVPRLLEVLQDHRLDRGRDSGPAFLSREGTRLTTDGVRSRLATIWERANELLIAAGRPPIGHLTPHTLRRSFASVLAVCNVPPRRAMYLLGHADAKFTMTVYQQVLDVPEQAIEDLERLLGCSLDEARSIYSGQIQWGPNGDPANKKASAPELSSMWEA